MKKLSVIPFAVLVLGVLGGLLRSFQLETGFEPITGLAEKGNPYSIALIVLSVITAAVLIPLLAKLPKRESLQGSELCADAPWSFIVMLFMLAGAVCLLVGAAIGVKSYLDGNSGLLDGVYFPITQVISAFCIFIFAITSQKKQQVSKSGTAAVLPIFFTCFWLVVYFRGEASNPVTADYIYQLFALIFSALGFYYSAGFIFGNVRYKRGIFSQCMAIFFCLVVQHDVMALPYKLLYVCLMLVMLGSALTLTQTINKE